MVAFYHGQVVWGLGYIARRKRTSATPQHIMPFQPQNHVFESRALYEVTNKAARHLATTPVQPLPLPSSFAGGGVYLIYYTGDYEPYSVLAKTNRSDYTFPIYAGKAVPTGWRQARAGTTESPNLYQRLNKHARSIRAVSNLNLDDFKCRILILTGNEADMIATVENVLIREYAPLWNSEIDGFGNNDPGVNRYDQILAAWDTLHPGRSWEQKWRGPRLEIDTLQARVRTYLG